VLNISATDLTGMAIAAIALIALSIWAQGFHRNPADLLGKRHIFFAFSGLLLVLALGGMLFKGFKLGMDFTGGTIIEIGFVENQDSVTPESVRKQIMAYAEKSGLHFLEPQVQVQEKSATGQDEFRRVIIRVGKEGHGTISTEEVQGLAAFLETNIGRLYRQQAKTLGTEPDSAPTPQVTAGSPAPAASPAVAAAPSPGVSPAGTPAPGETPAPASPAATTGILSFETIDPVIGRELFTNAFFALIVALGLQLIYITFRFGNQVRYGVAADLALIHDVIIMAGVYALTDRQVDSPFLAAVLTVIGYSVMDSIVVFDRIRENVRHTRKGNYAEICNASLNQTMTRSVNTTLTVLITLFALYFFGGDTLRNFAFALLVGVTMGAYSSIFVATPLVTIIDKWWKDREDQRVTERRARRDAERAEVRLAQPESAGYRPKRKVATASPLNESYPAASEVEGEEEGGRRAPDGVRRKKGPRRKKP